FVFSSRRRHTRFSRDWSSDVCSSDLDIRSINGKTQERRIFLMSAVLAPQDTTPAVQNERGLLRFITAGSVDDGKSTLIGRLLFDSKGIFADQDRKSTRLNSSHVK